MILNFREIMETAHCRNPVNMVVYSLQIYNQCVETQWYVLHICMFLP